MTPYFADEHLTVYLGDNREVMASMEPESVHCVVTSPPYWGLRDYGTATWTGGDEACPHEAPKGSETSTLLGGKATQESAKFYRGVCGACGATRQDRQLGLEPTPEAYVANMVAVFREVRRVLRKDGTLWLNLGDSYATSGGAVGRAPGGGDQGERFIRAGMINTQPNRMPIPGLKPKDLVGIPWRVAFALQADGWYLRSDIIWSKPNPMPESVTDRPTKSHEYLFLLSKSARYYFDADAVREDAGEWPGHEDRPQNSFHGKHGDAAFRAIRPAGRNIRSVWTIVTQPYPGAHFATFPRKLVEPCVKAGCPEGGTVLDPFAGSGTTALVAQQLGRRAVLIDLSADYLGQVMVRNAQKPLGLMG